MRAAAAGVAMAVPRLLRFGAHILDLDRLRLKGPSGHTELRPKCCEVLRYLLEHPGPGRHIADALRLRRAPRARDDGREFINIVPGRGYLFNAPV